MTTGIAVVACLAYMPLTSHEQIQYALSFTSLVILLIHDCLVQEYV